MWLSAEICIQSFKSNWIHVWLFYSSMESKISKHDIILNVKSQYLKFCSYYNSSKINPKGNLHNHHSANNKTTLCTRGETTSKNPIDQDSEEDWSAAILTVSSFFFMRRPAYPLQSVKWLTAPTHHTHIYAFYAREARSQGTWPVLVLRDLLAKWLFKMSSLDRRSCCDEPSRSTSHMKFKLIPFLLPLRLIMGRFSDNWWLQFSLRGIN